MYFWENNYNRAMQWAVSGQEKGKIKEPAVIGAVIDLSYCGDLLDSRFSSMVGTYHALMKLNYEDLHKKLFKFDNIK